MDGKTRCKWCNTKNPLYTAYHDREWGVLRTDDQYLYEMLILESFQAGLSWECVLNKRENFRKAYEGFDAERVILFDENKISELLQNRGIIRCQRKIRASIQNSKVFLEITREFGSFYNYLTTFTKGARRFETERTKSPLSDEIAKDLKARGMKFLGSVIIYSYLQAIGVIDSHEKACFLHKGSKEEIT
jgi:DNA-3-methyladenine glycosylase I